MDMRQLRYFVQIVESGSLAKASRQLYIAQPALSQQMARLEDEVGRQLLVRSSRGVTPTENGEALYHHAKFMLRQLDQAIAVARHESSFVSGRVAIGLAPTTICQLGMPLMQHFRAKYPGVILNIVEGLSGHLEHMTRIGQLDLAILFRGNAAAELNVEEILDEELFVILPRDSALVSSGQDSLTLSEVAQLPLILPSPGHGLRRRITLEFERMNLTMDPVAEIDSLPLLMQCVGTGMGATIKPRAAVHALGGSASQWRCLRISDAKMSRGNYLYSLPAEKLSSCAALVCNELKMVVRQLVNDGAWEGVTLAKTAPETSGQDISMDAFALAD
ncbi:LysR substrate-binding domain-containing protein [Diaphorobacter ruginosibacter]|uniref:LysR substrate-binding domain-containing protein n=1 Tax=Diaphorobacter ruginosibacter TaxID=1715720 RepID=UPI0033429EA5